MMVTVGRCLRAMFAEFIFSSSGFWPGGGSDDLIFGCWRFVPSFSGAAATLAGARRFSLFEGDVCWVFEKSQLSGKGMAATVITLYPVSCSLEF